MNKKQRGIYEKVSGSGVWWVRYADGSGRVRREKAGNKSAALKLYQKRKTEVLEGKKLPETLRAKKVTFRELARKALQYRQAKSDAWHTDAQRLKTLENAFGHLIAAPPPIEEFRRWFYSQSQWKPATSNRYAAMISLTYRLAIEDGSVSCSNPAKVFWRKEDNGRIRFLNQGHPDEEQRLRSAIKRKHGVHLPELEIALNTGMRRSEQYKLEWNDVDLVRRQLTVVHSKNGQIRYIPLNSEALAAFQTLYDRSTGEGYVFVGVTGSRLHGPRHWFERCVREAGLKQFTWHDLRHTFASRLVMLGVDLSTVRELLGHKTIQMTVRYAHLAPSHRLKSVEKLSSLRHEHEEATDTRTDTVVLQPIQPSKADVQ